MAIQQVAACIPTIAGIQVNGQATNTIIAGTNGYVSIYGSCLGSATSVQSDGTGLQFISILYTADGQVNASFQASGSASGGIHNVTVSTVNGTNGASSGAQVQIVFNISGQITASASGNPMSGVSVSLYDPNNNLAGLMLTGADGRYSFTVSAVGVYTLTPSYPNYAFNPQSDAFDITVIQTVNFVGTPVKTVYVLHGIGQGPADMQSLANNLKDGFVGIDPVRFRVDGAFDYSTCAQVGFFNCPSTCSISGGGQALANYIQNGSPPGDIILVGFSMGGLIARDLILNNYSGVLSGRAVTLITLGTPNLGYPHALLDDAVFCPNLVQGMAGNWRAIQPNGWPALSNYLYSSTQAWQSGSFPGASGSWLASYGRSCQNPIRNLDSTTGCQDASPRSDGVVCADSASYNVAAPSQARPTLTWFDPNYNYFHSNAGLGIATSFVLCASGANVNLLSNPPKEDTLFQTIVSTINAR